MAENEPPRLFGTNGVRGVVNGTIDPLFASRLGLAFSLSLRRKYGAARVKIGTDTRVSSEMLKSAVVSGLLSGGADVVDIGVSPSPAIQQSVGTDDLCDGGVIITASHNPPQFNGIKCISADGTEMSRDEEMEIERLFFSEIYGGDWTEMGHFSEDYSANDSYMDSIVSQVDAEAIKERHFRVVLDCSNGAASYTSPYILERLGCMLITLNCQPDGFFPGHMSEPTERNLKDTAAVVSALSADIGIAHDGDADRTVFIDETGRYISGNVSLAIFAKYMVRNALSTAGPAPPVVVTAIDSSSAVEDVVKEAGGVVKYTRIGSPVVARTMIREGAMFGGEGNGGAIFSCLHYFRDGAMSAAKMLEIMARTGKKLSELADEVPVYFQAKDSVDYSSLLTEGGVEAMSRIKERFMQALEGSIIDTSLHLSFPVTDRNTTDGIKLYVAPSAGETGWVLIRPSGTEPIIRVASEASDAGTAKKLVSETREFVLSVMKNL